MRTHRVRMPRMGTSVHESTVVQWLKKEGDLLAKGDPLLRAESDKVDFEVESPCGGRLLRILVPEEKKIPVGAELALIETEEEIPEEVGARAGPAAGEEWTAPVAPAAARAPARERREGPPAFLSPRVRRLAKELGLSEEELARLKGTGQGGRVTAEDVEAHLARRARVAPGAPPGPPAPPAGAPFVPSTAPLATDGQRERRVSLGRLRRRIAENLTRSVQTIPQANLHMEADVTRLVEWRETHKGEFQGAHGFRLTFMPFFSLSVVGALREARFASFNASLEGEELILKRYVNLGVAVAVPDGLIVPVVPNAETLPFLDLARAIEDLSSRARAGKLLPDEVRGGTFTVTNAGSTGMLFGTPIINPPEAAILSVGTIERRLKVLPGDAIALRHLVVLSLTFDHRINDGMAAGLFLRSIREALENVDLGSLAY